MHMTPLFSGGELDAWLNQQLHSARDHVRKASPRHVRDNPAAVYEDVLDHWRVEPLDVRWSEVWRDEPREINAVREQFGTLIRYTAYGINVHVPYTGSSELFQRTPSTRSLSGMPVASVRADELVVDIQMMKVTAEDFERIFQAERDHIQTHVGSANAQVRAWVGEFEASISKAIADRKKGLDLANEVAGTLSIPARPAPASTQIQIPAERKSVRVLNQSDKDATPEYALDLQIYEDVVRTLRAVGNSFERLPATVNKFDEEELRDLLLFILNSNYEGAAGGELFNGAGKTDILVRYADRNAFVGECKFWDGQAAFSKAIDQLLSYTVWRDTKAALVLFITKKNALAAIETADRTIRAHASFVSAQPPPEPSLRRDYVLHAKDDPQRLISTALLPIVIREPVK